MNIILSTAFVLSLICYLNGLHDENAYLDKGFVDLETLPLKKLLEMKKELGKKGKLNIQIIYEIYEKINKSIFRFKKIKCLNDRLCS